MRLSRRAAASLLPLLVATLAGTACQRPSSPRATGPAAGSDGAAGAPAADAPGAPGLPAPDADPAAARRKRDEAIDAALARVPKLRDEVSRMRGLAAPEVPAERQSQEDFQRFLRGELDLELDAAKSARVTRALHHLGLLAKPDDLRAAVEDAFLSQAGAYYDPATKKFFVVLAIGNGMILDSMLAHELAHALQDRHFDLLAYLGGKGNAAGLSEDTVHARRFVVEGEATLVMLAYIVRSMTGVDSFRPEHLAQLRMQTEMMANMDTAQVAAMSTSADAFIELGPEFKHAMDALDTIPPYVLAPLYDAYFKGARAVLEAYADGGWASVDRLFREPPDSTEQVLHPRTKLLGATRDYPTTVTLAAPGGRSWTPLHEDTLGELLWGVYLKLWGAPDPARAAAGWDGDRYAVYADGERTLGLIATVWDSREEATEFAAAYRATLERRGRTARARVVEDGAQVLIADGCDGEADCDAAISVLRRTRTARHPKER